MSSFRNQGRSVINRRRIGRCEYCNHAPVSTKGECSQCRFIQPQASPQVVQKNQSRYKRMIQRVFVITLKDKASRWDLFQQRTLPYLSRYECTKYVGIDGRNMESVLDTTLDLFPKEDQELYEKVMEKREQYEGSTGCYLSHLSLWNHIYNDRKDNEEFVLILEDDAKFEPYGVQNMERLLNDLQDAEFDILYLGHSPQLKGTKITSLLMRPPSKSEPVYRTNCGFWGYVVRVSSLPNLINAVSSFQDQSIDETIQRQFGELVDALFVVKPLVTQSSLYSVRVTMDQKRALR